MNDTHVLYRMFDTNKTLLYVGITNDPKSRFKTHSKTKPWWSQVSQITVETFDSREALSRAEQIAIRAENPRHNIALQSIRRLPPPPEPPRPQCPECLSTDPRLMPLGCEVLLMEDGSELPFCVHPFHMPENPELAKKVYEQRDLLRQSTLLRMSAEAARRMERQRAALEMAFKPITDHLNWPGRAS